MDDKHMGHEPADLAMITADDQLLDLLGGGGTPDDGDEVSDLLAAWRADLGTDLTDRSDRPDPTNLADDRPSVRAATPPAVGMEAERQRRPRRTLLAAAAAVVALAGGATIVAGDARPGSPLWPITQIFYAERASSAVAAEDAQHAIDDARAAIEQSQYSDAEKLLDQASARANEVRDPGVVQRLLDQIAALRALLPGGAGSTAGTAPSAAAGQGGGAGPGGGGASPGQSASTPGGLLPTGILPTDILPTGILPTGILPTTLPPLLP